MGREDNGLRLEGLTQKLETLEHQNAERPRKVATLGGSGRRSRTDGEANPISEGERVMTG